MKKITNPKHQITNKLQIPMTKKNSVIWIWILCVVPIGSNFGFVYWNLDIANAGSVQFSTYYPAPFGMYDRLRLVPRANLDTQLPCDPGTMYINADASNELEVCNAAGNAWAPLSSGPWTKAGSNIYATDTVANVGIGTTTPTSRLHIVATEGYTPPGVFLEGADINVDGGPDGQFMIRNNSGSGTQKIFLAGSGGSVLTVDGVAGNVGIGTTTPNNKLQVSGLVNFDNTLFSTSLGYQAGNVNTGGNNTFVGYQSGQTNTTGNQNTFLGFQSGLANTSGGGNTFVGYNSGPANTWGQANTFLGRYSGKANTGGNFNTFLGDSAGEGNTTADNNTFVGYRSGLANTTGYQNTAIGRSSLGSNTTGYDNTASGISALYSNTTGYYNTASGKTALYSNTTGSYNTATGFQALYSNTTGIYNTANGAYALYLNTGNSNTATGMDALRSNTTGTSNTANGVAALGNNTTGNSNTVIGSQAGFTNTTGSGNILIGNSINAPTATTSNYLNIGNAITGDLASGNVAVAGILDASKGIIVETRTTNPAAPVAGQMWLCTDTGDATPCNGI